MKNTSAALKTSFNKSFKSAMILALSMGLCAGSLAACDSDDGNANGVQNQNSSGVGNKLIKSSLARADSNIAVADRDAFVKGQYDLNFDLIRKSADQIGDDNAMISTFSIQMALAMTWAGADGDTASEMASALHFDANTHAALNKLDRLINSKNKDKFSQEMGPGEVYEKDAVEIKTNNDLYFAGDSYSWSSDWLDTLAINYGAGLTELDFAADPEAARKYINDIVSADTHDRIKDLIPSGGINVNTKSVLTNAIYFKAPWDDRIHKADNKLSFHKLDGSNVDVDYLYVSARYEYMVDENDLYQAVSVPLRDDDFNVMFVLPADGKFNDVQAALNGDIMGNIFSKLAKDSEINLKFPTYSFETSLKLKKPLKELGMDKAFEADQADFSKMTSDANSLFIGDVFHKTFVGLDENGVEAAAATAVLMVGNGTPGEEIIDLNLDKPYFFIIYESDSKTPLFVGRVMDPSK